MKRVVILLVLLVGATVATAPIATAQEPVIDPALLQAMHYRNVGPYRGGRVTAVEGVSQKPFTFYMGGSGGVWRTTNVGMDWTNVTDGFFEVGSIGAIDVADSDPNVIYVGTGSGCIRGNVSVGIGLYKSTDGARTWRHIGLRDIGQVGRIAVHPRNPDLVYVAATGRAFGRNEERGVYRSTDGGASWEKMLYINDRVGAIDLAINPGNPRQIFAAMWQVERKPWTMISGGKEGGVYRSSDGGDTWTKLEKGLPEGLTGRIGVAVSPVTPNRVWAIVEAEERKAGVYRSEDSGDSWSQVNDNPRLLVRPWYYNHIYADPGNANTVWVAGGTFWKSVDGGKSFDSLEMPHGDHHALWLNPDNPDVMVQGNDGGAIVSVDGGESWSPQFNQPTAEFYSLTVDERFPYRVYGPQQDNSTISVPSQSTGTGITFQHWLAVGGCETGPVAVRPDDPNIVYSGCFGGKLARFDRRTEQFRQIRDYPQLQDGSPARDLRYRIQWNAPIELSPHDPGILYHGSQYVHRSTNEGQSWEIISPDLTRNDDEKLGMPGGPITHDATGVEVYSALLALAESTHAAGVLWTGSNDGMVHLSRDNGKTWSDISPPDLPQPATINRIELSPHRPGKAYLAVYRYRMDDFRPYIYRTDKFGESWTPLTGGSNGIPADHPTRIVREDPEREGLLYAGTEFGLFVSFDDGAHWQALQLNLPPTPVTDLRVHRGDLVVATQGRSFWILDDLTPLRELDSVLASADLHLFAPRRTYRTGVQSRDGHYDRDKVFGLMLPRSWKGENPPEGAIIYYILGEGVELSSVEILDSAGKLVRNLDQDLPSETGLNRLVWDLRHPEPDGGGMEGPRAVPGTYTVRLNAGELTASRRFEVQKDPRQGDITQADLEEQADYLLQVRSSLDRLNKSRETIRSVREQIDALVERLDDDTLEETAAGILEDLLAIEEELVQTRPGGYAHPPKIRRNLAWAARAASSQRNVYLDARPTDQLWERFRDLDAALSSQFTVLERVLREDLTRFNESVRAHGVSLIAVPKKKATGTFFP